MTRTGEGTGVLKIAEWPVIAVIIAAGVGALGLGWGYAQTVHAHRQCAHQHFQVPPAAEGRDAGATTR